jgi:hypothetical protein
VQNCDFETENVTRTDFFLHRSKGIIIAVVHICLHFRIVNVCAIDVTFPKTSPIYLTHPPKEGATMSERSMRKRPERVVQPTPGALAQKAALQVIGGRFKGAREAAAYHNIDNYSLVTYYMRKFAGTDVATTLCTEATETTPEKSSDSGMRAASPLMPQIPTEVIGKSRFFVKQWIAQQAAHLVNTGECTLRAAAELANRTYGALELPSVSHTMIASYTQPEYQPESGGRPGILPKDFTDRLVAWIRARRALKFPVFRDDVLAVANRILCGNPLQVICKSSCVVR